MRIQTIQDILPLVEKPSRYLGTEHNSIRKNHDQVKLSIALAFPDLYEIGTSHFGLQILYDLLNQHRDIAAERVFAPAVDMENHLRASGLPLFTLESQKPLSQFDMIGFSLLYELNYTNVLTMLDLAGIPFTSAERNASHPLIIAGGPCACNPEPVADFFDAIVIGDGEETIMEMAGIWLKMHNEPNQDRTALLKAWSQIEGIYIPAFFEPRYEQQSDNGPALQTLKPLYTEYTRVKRAVVPQLDQGPFPMKPVLPYGRPVHDRLRLEIGRGCSRGCRFCQAGMIYRPVRERSMTDLLDITEKSLAATGYEDISLLSLSTGDYGCLVPLMENLIRKYESEKVAVSLPSIRAGTLTPELMKLIREVRKTGFTIAPEAGTQRLRDVINKNISEKEIFDTVTGAFELGWQVIKLYFMIGHPTETDADIQGIVDLVKKLWKIKGPKGRRSKINVSITTFIPKPHTPFQWAPQIPLSESREKISWLREKLKLPGIQVKWQNPEVSRLEGLWARGDRRLSHLLITAYRKGCRFDGWSDQFRFDLWQEAFQEENIDPDVFITRSRNAAEPLPWNHIDTGVSKHFLQKEWQNAMQGALTPDCRQGECCGCGVCNFETLQPVVFAPDEVVRTAGPAGTGSRQPVAYKKLRVSYSKTGQARYFGHLEMVNIFSRAIRRAGIHVKYSGGFHPMPRISFGNPLPLGMESLEEHFYVTVPQDTLSRTVVQRLNRELPEGLKVYDCRTETNRNRQSESGGNTGVSIVYQVTLKEERFDPQQTDAFFRQPEVIITRTRRKGKIRQIDLKSVVSAIDLLDYRRLQIILRSEKDKTVRPLEVIKTIFDLSETDLKQANVIKMAVNADGER